ncbi:MAG: epoxyqueuosine reductase QueH [Clostridia bacterium]|nr:epoxyqueuosine reductase QueH [Clostridia bacterium]
MNKINYDSEMQKVISGFDGEKKSILLHACCAPCSTHCIERLKDYFDITVYFYNPNMDTENEYNKRAEEIKKFCGKINVNYIIENYNEKEFLDRVKGLEQEKEGGARCTVCYNLRLEKTAMKAKEKGFDFFSTTLTISPLKDAERLNNIGLALSEKYKVSFLPSDFKKKGGYLRSIELSKEYGLYRQNYCGCKFSKNEK